MLEKPEYEQNHYSITSTGIYKNAHDSIRIMKVICCYDRSYYENTNFYHLMGSVLKCLKETSER